jgi:hypothetical protein
MNETAKSVLAWTTGGVLSASVLWWLLGGVLYGILNGAPISFDPAYVSLMWVGLFGFLTSVVFAGPYSALLFLWLTRPPHVLRLDGSRLGVIGETFLLSLPAILILSVSFGGWPGRLPFDWEHALAVLPAVAASAWGGLLLPRLVLRRLRPLRSPAETR